MSSMSPNFTLKAPRNWQKSPEHSLAGFLPLLTFLVGVCICGAVDCYIISQHTMTVLYVCNIVLKRDAIYAMSQYRE